MVTPKYVCVPVCVIAWGLGLQKLGHTATRKNSPPNGSPWSVYNIMHTYKHSHTHTFATEKKKKKKYGKSFAQGHHEINRSLFGLAGFFFERGEKNFSRKTSTHTDKFRTCPGFKGTNRLNSFFFLLPERCLRDGSRCWFFFLCAWYCIDNLSFSSASIWLVRNDLKGIHSNADMVCVCVRERFNLITWGY